MIEPEAILVVVRPHQARNLAPGAAMDRFDAYVDGELICTSRQPLHEAARKLRERGVPDETPLVMRHEGAEYDSTLPHPLGLLADWTVTESDRKGIIRSRWQPFDRSVYEGADE